MPLWMHIKYMREYSTDIDIYEYLNNQSRDTRWKVARWLGLATMDNMELAKKFRQTA